jgi:hypothetical protein
LRLGAREPGPRPADAPNADGWRAIRSLATDWLCDLSKDKQEHPSLSSFKDWLGKKGYSHYLNFRCRMGADYDAEM